MRINRRPTSCRAAEDRIIRNLLDVAANGSGREWKSRQAITQQTQTFQHWLKTQRSSMSKRFSGSDYIYR